jgi:hypothetical protein
MGWTKWSQEWADIKAQFAIFKERPGLCATVIIGALACGSAGWAIGHYFPRTMVAPVPLVSPPPRMGSGKEVKASPTKRVRAQRPTRFEQRHPQARRCAAWEDCPVQP